MGSTIVKVSRTAETLVAGMPPCPVIGTTSVCLASTGARAAPRPTRVSNKRAGGNDIIDPQPVGPPAVPLAMPEGFGG